MKKLIMAIIFIPYATYGAAPATSCPSGYVALEEPYLTIANSELSCINSAGTATTCLTDNPAGVCFMYVPTGTTYTDESGSYEFTSICPLT